jgi:hypothetical protein
LYASCASIFTDKVGDDPHGFWEESDRKVFLPQNAFERSLVDWDGTALSNIRKKKKKHNSVDENFGGLE